MSKSKKFELRVVQNDTGWTVEIIRQKTAKETIVSKSQDGFTSAEEAQAWGETELESFLKALTERNKRRAINREIKFS
ncbi:DUF3622 domain-containing protein [Neptunomonas antarctica]|uniref:DUF3622 domain-containing protein n=1 Tax=Neptunomonas antarctica TaxID=619304 RepID=A0A1N7NMX0_9GAMM|nr:DUF3622 domain-containing protein [Neptunomonas antarctica]SIS99704.1 Protein of unknown function [Neptunomonas antarctica]